MFFLFSATVTASFFDSLNPSAIAQMMLIQAMVKNKRHTWFFIAGIVLANFVMGMAVYYGVAAWASRLFAAAASAYPFPIRCAIIAGGLASLAYGLRLLVMTRRGRAAQDEEGPKAPASLSPFSLFVMGAAFCGVELTGALPYFGFIAMVASAQVSFAAAMFLFGVYNFMYALPLILLYFGYNRLRGTAALGRLEAALGRVSVYVVPGALTLLGPALVFFGATL